MNQSTPVLCERVKKEEILIEHVPVQESRKAEQPQELPSAPPAEALKAAFVGYLVTRMQSIGEQYSNSVLEATKELIQRMDTSIGTQSISRRRRAIVRGEIKAARVEFEGRVLEAAGKLSTQRQFLIEEVQCLGGEWNGSVLENIEKTEAALKSEEQQIEQMIENSSVEIAHLMRVQAAHNEKKAYLEGLKFRALEITL